MGLDERVSRLIGRIYESAFDPEAWDLVIEDVLEQTESRTVLISVSDFRDEQMNRAEFRGRGGVRYDEARQTYHGERLYLEDRTFHFALRHPFARFCETADVIPRETYLDDPVIRYARDYFGATHWIVGYTAPVDELTFGFSILPPAAVGPPTKRNKSLFKMLFEHMDHALRLAARPPVLESGKDAAVILDRSGHVRTASIRAQQLFEAADGLTLCRGKLAARTIAGTQRVNEAIASALNALVDGSHGGAVALPRPSGKRDLLLTFTPLPRLPSMWRAFQPAVLVKIVDPEDGTSPAAAERWSGLFGLTPAEARLAAELVARDCNLRSAADELGIAYWTARVHLQKLLEKTGCHSQAQMIRTLTRVE
ncbi:MAG TPA: hypothetical protein VM346_06730 [Sphingomicrobium sp.]|nr:hypothetical protein [Sphingomicrobium sp.]